MEGYSKEPYHVIKVKFPYDDHYLDGDYDEQTQINDLLSEWEKRTKPASYRLLNAQIIFINPVTSSGRTWGAKIQHVLHIAYVKK